MQSKVKQCIIINLIGHGRTYYETAREEKSIFGGTFTYKLIIIDWKLVCILENSNQQDANKKTNIKFNVELT